MKSVFNIDEIVIFDMEVTGFKLEPNVLVQFSARKYNGNKLIDSIDILINNNLKLSSSFKKRTRISEKLLKQKGISLERALLEIKSFIGNNLLVTYKGNFFYLQLLWFLFNNNIKNYTIDIIDIAKEYGFIGNPDDITIEDLCLSLQLDYDENRICNSHYDVILIEKIWFKLKSLLKDK